MTTKDVLAGFLREQGYDLVTACEMAQKAIDEFIASNRDRQTLYIGNHLLTLERKWQTP